MVEQSVITSTDHAVKKKKDDQLKKRWPVKKHSSSWRADEQTCGRYDSLDHSTSIPTLCSVPFHSTHVGELKPPFLRCHCGPDFGCDLGSTNEMHTWNCEIRTELNGGKGNGRQGSILLALL